MPEDAPTPSSPGHQQMDQKQKDVIQAKRDYLVKNMCVSPVFLAPLLSAFVITCDEMDRLLGTPWRKDATLFCQLIVCKGPGAFAAFMEALTRSQQHHIREEMCKDMPTLSDRTVADPQMPEGMAATHKSGTQINPEDEFGIGIDDTKFLAQNKDCLILKAVDEGKANVLSLLLRYGANVDVCDDEDQSLLHRAVRAGPSDVIDLLIGAGLSVNSIDSHGRTPLHVSIMAGNSAASLHLIKDCDADISMVDILNRNALFLACQFGCLATARLLLERGADFTTKKINTTASALDTASYGGHHDIVALLLKHGAVVHVCRDDGTTPLLVASQEGHSQVVKLLLAAGAAVDTREIEGFTPLLMASIHGHSEVVQLLLDAGAAVDARHTGKGCSSLWVAGSFGHNKVVQLLLAAGASVDTPNIGGATPLWVASQEGHDEVVQVLLAVGADVGSRCDRCKDRTPLHIASYRGNRPVVSVLLGEGAAVNAADRDGNTPLHLACRQGHTEIARVLLQHPAVDWRIKNKSFWNRTACSIAKAHGHRQILALFPD